MSGTATTHGSTVEGALVERKDEAIVLALPGTDYRLHLVVDAAAASKLASVKPGDLIHGSITARAKRVDIINTGGRFIEPVFGRPRRLQGRVTAIDAGANTLTVYCGFAFVCTPIVNQQAATFQVGQIVAFDVERGAQFHPA